MKTVALSSLLFLTCAQSAVAVSVVDLSVQGQIIPRACTPLLSGSGLIDYGKISRQDLNLEQGTRLPLKTLQVSIDCNGPSRYALRMRDNRDGSATVNSEIYYGLGFDTAGNRLGLYSMSFDPRQTQADSNAQIYGTESTTGGLGWRTSNLNPIDIGATSYLGFTDTEGSTAGPTAIATLNTTVQISTVINARKNLDLSVETDLDGSATLEVVYL
ncbi:DUF1120 domain-containing protein [Pseudomonas proteolytica]|uniref:DUF1120 domain-containing protein n=1 Tax=Pseudomonas proteolytica TaxID=219574 RepID=UPI001474C680|nr:DUF1120 domain-containing protein [Pseudomonas proteolytica]NMZ33245.1 DUF1120 domain-containing protein [Pseudomonas proteolytica]